MFVPKNELSSGQVTKAVLNLVVTGLNATTELISTTTAASAAITTTTTTTVASTEVIATDQLTTITPGMRALSIGYIFLVIVYVLCFVYGSIFIYDNYIYPMRVDRRFRRQLALNQQASQARANAQQQQQQRQQQRQQQQRQQQQRQQQQQQQPTPPRAAAAAPASGGGGDVGAPVRGRRFAREVLQNAVFAVSANDDVSYAFEPRRAETHVDAEEESTAAAVAREQRAEQRESQSKGRLIWPSQLTVRVDGRDIPIDDWRRHMEEVNKTRTFPRPIHHCSVGGKVVDDTDGDRPTNIGRRMASFVSRRLGRPSSETREYNERSRQLAIYLQTMVGQRVEPNVPKTTADADPNANDKDDDDDDDNASAKPLLAPKEGAAAAAAVAQQDFVIEIKDDNGNPQTM